MTVWKCATVGCYNSVAERGARCAECRNSRLVPDGGIVSPRDTMRETFMDLLYGDFSVSAATFQNYLEKVVDDTRTQNAIREYEEIE
jgi:hypothetical protein